jgi:hypothetical protein
VKILKFVVEETIKENNKVVTNGNGFGVKFKFKKSKAWLGKIGVVVCANRRAHI